MFPKSAFMGRWIAKDWLLKNEKTKPSPVEDKFLVDEVSKITWLYNLSKRTINLEGEKEIQVFEIILKSDELSDVVLKYLSKIHDRIIFIIKHDGSAGYAVNYGKVYRTGWGCADLEISGLTLDNVYLNFVKQIAGASLIEDETLDDALERQRVENSLQKNLTSLEKKAQREKQPRLKLKILKEIAVLNHQPKIL